MLALPGHPDLLGSTMRNLRLRREVQHCNVILLTPPASPGLCPKGQRPVFITMFSLRSPSCPPARMAGTRRSPQEQLRSDADARMLRP